MNTNWLGVAFAQVDTWEPITPAQHASARWLLQEISRRTGIPLRFLTHVTGRYGDKGMTEHRLTAQGQFGGKSDVGGLLRWEELLA